MTDDETLTIRRTRPRILRLAAIGSATALGVAAIVAGLWSGAGAYGTKEPVIQRELDGLVEIGFPAALGSKTDASGRHTDYVSGVGDRATDAKVPVNGEVRIGSNTKTFTAVTVLQLVQEGEVGLDAPIDTYLPGLVHGEGIDGSAITVRQLLQHTSGLPEYTTTIGADIAALQHSYFPPRDLVDLALAQPAHFAPGAQWEYSNTNYVILGMLIEKLEKRPLFEVITSRIIEPLGLADTYFPAVGEQRLRGTHPKGYHVDASGEQFDVSVLDPSFGWAAGAIVATPSDLNDFFRAVFDGRLLDDATMAEMKKTVPSDDGLSEGIEYGLGVQSSPLSCGGLIWGHGGDIHGYETRNGVAEDGTAFTVAVTSLPWGFIDQKDEEKLLGAYKAVIDTVDAAFCAA